MSPSDDPPTRVLIVDDHAAYRFGVRDALEGRGFEVCGEAASGPDAVRVAQEQRPEVILMDISMLGGDGITATEEIRQKLPETKVIMLTALSDDKYLFGAIKAGSIGYLMKDAAAQDLPRAIHSVLAGEQVFSPGLAVRVMNEFRQRDRPRLFRSKRRRTELTEREWEILQLLREGLSTREIAGRLTLSPTAVRTHISIILEKLQVSDRKAAVKAMEESGD